LGCAVASAHSLLVAIYHLLRDGTVFQDLGPLHFENRNREAVRRRSLRRLEQLGYRVTLEEATA
jgi:transposase